jgi:Glycosyl transferases group 1
MASLKQSPAATRPVVNGVFVGHAVGTGSWSECLANVAPEWRRVVPRLDPTAGGRWASARKTAYELGFRRHRGAVRVHPYAACALDRRAALVVLDAIGLKRASGWHSALVRWSIALAAHVATISTPQQEQLHRRFGRTFGLLTPHPHPDFFQVPRVEFHRSGPLRLVYWGGWHARKGITELITSIQPSRRVEMLLVGPVPSAVAARADVRVLPTLSRRHLIRLIDGSDAALYPSREEGFGLPPYEALLRGRVVVARDLPCYGDYMTRDRRGVLDPDGPNFWEDLQRVRTATDIVPEANLKTPTLNMAEALLREQVDRWLNGD